MRKVAAFMLMIGVVLFGGFAVAQETELRINGSTTVGPIAEAFVEAMSQEYPNVKFSVTKTGSGDGAAALIDGRCDIAAMSRFMKAEEFKTAAAAGIMPVPFTVAMDGVCPIVHPSNPVSALTTAQLRAIYTGEITNWSQVGGANMPIIVISRDTSSGTYEVFHEIAMKKEKMGLGTEYVGSNPQAFERVKSTPGAIAYVGIGFVKDGVRALTLDGITATKRTIATGKFPLARPLFLFTNGFPKLGSLTHAYSTFYLTEDGQDIVDAKGFVPVTDY